MERIQPPGENLKIVQKKDIVDVATGIAIGAVVAIGTSRVRNYIAARPNLGLWLSIKVGGCTTDENKVKRLNKWEKNHPGFVKKLLSAPTK